MIETEDSLEQEPQNITESAATTDAIADSVIDLAEWIIPVGELEIHERKKQESQPQTVLEIAIVEEQPSSLYDTTTESSEPIPDSKPFLFIQTPKTATPPQGKRRADRVGLGQLAFDFGDSYSEPANSNEASKSFA